MPPDTETVNLGLGPVKLILC